MTQFHGERAQADMATVIYDLKGLQCPLPVLKTRKKLQDLPAGALLQVETTDPLSQLDMTHFCQQDGHALLDYSNDGRVHRFLIRKN